MILHRADRYRNTSTAELLAEAEAWLWDLAELETDLAEDPTSWDFPDGSLAFAVAAIEDANAEIARRQRIQHHPAAPSWPRRWIDHRGELETIRATLDLAAFIERQCFVTLERRGAQLWCRCPLPGHDDSTPSFAVHPVKQVWYCHGCHRGGDIFSFLMHALGTDRFADVVRVLAAEAGVEAARNG